VAKPKTFFEQVPLVVVKKIVEEEAIPKKTVVVKLRRDTNTEQEELQFPEWQKPLQDLILEFDRERLLEKVKKVEAMIIERDRQLSQAGDSHAERMALSDAMAIIRVLTDRTAN
jgi:hypothetical protein